MLNKFKQQKGSVVTTAAPAQTWEKSHNFAKNFFLDDEFLHKSEQT